MDTPTYPGKGLSLSQLIFALNEELRRVTCSSSFALDEVSQFDRDLSNALTAVREWKNSFVPINRIPLDILSLIPTHLSSEKDRFRTASVCRHWRRTFLRYGVLWSQLFLRNGEDYVSTLLERANGSALEVVTNHDAPLGTMVLLSPHVQQIRYLDFASSCWTDILAFCEDNPGPLPLLHTLKIQITGVSNPHVQPNTLTALSLPFFSGAVNLQEFVFESSWGLNLEAPLKNFVFPNLTTLKLDVSLTTDFNISDVLGFLKASPTLREVQVKIRGNTAPEGIPREMVVVLPNVETFSLVVTDDGRRTFDPAHISCPGANYTSLIHQICDMKMAFDLMLFPAPDSWKAITRQYSTSPVEEVTLKINDSHLRGLVTSTLTFQSFDATVIQLEFVILDTGMREERLPLSLAEMNLEIYSEACRTIRDHPLLSHVKRLHINNEAWNLYANTLPMAGVVGQLLGSLGPLDEFTIHDYDLRAFLAPFVDTLESRNFKRVFPPVKQFAVSGSRRSSMQQCMDIVELAKSQHELKKPFDHVTLHAMAVPAAMVEKLRQWVGTVDCCER